MTVLLRGGLLSRCLVASADDSSTVTMSTVPALPSTVTTLTVVEPRGRAGDADDGRDAVLAGEDREVAERAARLGDERPQPGDDRSEPRVEVADHQHGADRHVAIESVVPHDDAFRTRCRC